MVRFLLLLCVLGSAFAALGMGPDQLLQKYSHIKMLSSCFGEEVLQDYLDHIRAANAICHHDHHESHGNMDSHSNEDVSEDHEHTSEEHDDVKENSESVEHDEGSEENSEVREIKYVPLPYYLPYGPHLNRPYQTLSHQKYTVSLRNRRHVHYEEEGTVFHNIVKKTKNLQCVLQELNITDEEGGLNVGSLKATLDEMAIPTKLRNDFEEALDECLDFAMCHPTEEAKHPLVQKLGRTMAFMRCVHKMETIVCMKQDFTKYLLMEEKNVNEESIFELMMTFGEGQDIFDLF